MTYEDSYGAAGSTTSVSALFDSQADAERAVDRLVAAGVPRAQIRTVDGASSTGGTTTASSGEDRGFWDSLADFFFPEEDRYSYAEGLSRGGCLVAVSELSASEYETALDILDDEGTVNLDEREQNWRSEGWGGYETSSYAGSAAATGTAAAGAATSGYTERAATTEDESIPIVEERLRVGKRDASHGRVRVRAYTVEQPVSETVELREDHVELERRPVDRAATGTEAAFQDRTLEAEEYREEAVVSKEARVVEEVSLRKTTDTHSETVSDTVRHTEVEVDVDRDGRDDLDHTGR